MKKVLFTITAITFLLTGFSSCNKCEVCTKSSQPEVRICEKDYDSNTAYGLALDVYEVQGYTCKKSI